MTSTATPRSRGAGLRVAVLQHEPQTGLGAFSGLLDEAGVDYEVFETSWAARLPDIDRFDGTIVLGGSLGAHDPALRETRRWIHDAIQWNMPFLGICLGGQLLARALGGFVERASRPEVGVTDIYLTDAARRDPLFGDLPRPFSAFSWHADAFRLPRRSIPLAGSIACEHQAFRFGANAYALQFHPEVRPEDLARWAAVPAYQELLEHAGADWGDVMSALERARPKLDALAAHLIEAWVGLVADAATALERQSRVAV